MNTDWERLRPLQLGRYGEYYAKMEFASWIMICVFNKNFDIFTVAC